MNTRRYRTRRGKSAEASQRRRAGLPFDETDHQEQRGLHDDVMCHAKIAPLMPSRLDSATPKTMYPMWLTNVKDSSRLMSFCAMAPECRRASSRAPPPTAPRPGRRWEQQRMGPDDGVDTDFREQSGEHRGLARVR